MGELRRLAGVGPALLCVAWGASLAGAAPPPPDPAEAVGASSAAPDRAAPIADAGSWTEPDPAATTSPLAAPPPSSPTAAAGPPAPPGPVAAPSGRVSVDVVSRSPLAVLEHRPKALEKRGDLAGVDGWRAVCIAPCRAELDPEDRLRVGGSDAAPLYFVLPEGEGPFTVYAAPGSAASETAGFAMILTGSAVLLAGVMTAVILATGPIKNAADDSAPVIAMHASVTSIVIGAVVLAIGVPLRAFAGGEIRVEQPSARGPGPPLATAATGGLRLRLATGLYLTPGGIQF